MEIKRSGTQPSTHGGAPGTGEYRVMLGAALNVGITPAEAKEIVYQAVPYVGMGKVFDFLHATNDALRGKGIALPLPSESTTTRERTSPSATTAAC
jgi:4-carboxymuconolactone decarboxylase